MKHPTSCKFCKKSIVLEIDDSYDVLGDPRKIIPLAACNRCADLRVRRRNLEDAANKVAMRLVQAGDKVSSELSANSREAFTKITKKYTILIADWVNSTAPFWDQTIVELLMEKPDRWPTILQQCWKLYKQKST